MSATVDFTTLTNAVAALSITGVTILDVDELPVTIGLDTHVLAPMPAGFISNVEVIRDEVSAQKLVLKYSATWRYYHCRVSNELLTSYSGMIDNLAKILLAFCSDATLAGSVDNDSPQIANVGPVADPAGNVYHGFDISLHITQFLEV